MLHLLAPPGVVDGEKPFDVGRAEVESIEPEFGGRRDDADVTRERTREIETVSGLESTLAFYDSLPQGLFAVAPDGRIAHVNATLSQWLRLRPKRPHADAARHRAGRRRRPDPRCGARRPHDAARARSAARGWPHLPRAARLPRPWPRGIISVLVLDRSEEPTRAEAHAHTEMRLTRVFQSAPFGIATADAGGRIVTANAAFMRMFAVEGRGVPTTVAGLVPDGEEEAGRELAKALERAVSGRTGAAPIEVSFGSQRELARRIYVSALGAGPRAREGAVLYAIDATEQKALELKFAQSHKMEAVGKLAGGVAHDFNNVLTAIIGFSDLLLQTHRQTDPAYRDIMNIKSSANRAAGLVRQLLAFSRRQTLQPEVLELGEILTDLAPLLNRSLGEKIELKIVSGPRPVARQGRQDAVRQRHHQPGRQRQGRDARRRLPHHPHAQRERAREPEARAARAWPPASTC